MKLACLALAALAAMPALAREWPSGPVHIVVPFAPGSTPDIVARIVADRLSARIGQPAIVDNKPGAGGNLGTDAVAKAAPDGQTVGLSIAGPLGVNALLYKSLPYDPARDLAPLMIAATQPSILVIAPRLNISTTAQLLALLQAAPGKYNYSSMGAGTISHLAMEALAARSGTQVVHVPYSGSSAAVLALLTGEVDVACLPAGAVMPQIQAGKLVALAVATRDRSAALPGIPTLREAGIENVFADAWMGFVVPARTPAPVMKRLRDEIGRILAQPDVREKLGAQFMDVVGGTPQEFRAVVAADIARWRPIIARNLLRLD